MNFQAPLIPLQSFESPRGKLGARFRRNITRGVALFFGSFALLNILGGLRSAHFDANLWWIDLRFLPQIIAEPLVFVSALCFIAFAVQPPNSAWRRRATFICAVTLGVFALVNAADFYLLLARGGIVSRFPLPLSLVVAAAMISVARASSRNALASSFRQDAAIVLAVAVACVVCFPLAQMLCFGKTDYRRPADAAVVLGARVYADGHPSDALADRVRTACQLYRDGMVHKLIFSGGPGDGAIHEAESMRRMAVKLGVKPEDILMDDAGLNTFATVRNSEAMFSQTHASRILVVSHFYHLPRIKLAFQRDGWDVYTVPAKESYLLRQMPYNMAREVAALWVYYLRPLAGSRG
jgi:vancomycin permeability regulator SanA